VDMLYSLLYNKSTTNRSIGVWAIEQFSVAFISSQSAFLILTRLNAEHYCVSEIKWWRHTSFCTWNAVYQNHSCSVLL